MTHFPDAICPKFAHRSPGARRCARGARLVAALALMGAGALHCSSENQGKGAAAFSTWGEGYIEDQIPASEFEDGWSVRYDRFLIVIRSIDVADDTGNVVAMLEHPRLVNHKQPGVKPIVTFPNLDAKNYGRVSYAIGPISNDTELLSATDDDRALMAAGGYSVYVEGVAEKQGSTKRFAWGFTDTTLYVNCTGDIDGKEVAGVQIRTGGTDAAEITIHGDHLFYDDLQSPDAKLRFDNIAAADQDQNGEVTMDELAAVRLASIPESAGSYGTGSASHVGDLGAFVRALTRTIGHFRGEGHCSSVARE